MKVATAEETEQVIVIFNQGYLNLQFESFSYPHFNFHLFYAVTVDVLRDWEICISIKIRARSNGNVIPEGCFSGWPYLKSIEPSYRLYAIESFAFDGCDSLQEVNLSECTTLTYIRTSAFRNCHNLTAIRLPDTLKEIGASAFESCYQLQGIQIPSSTQSVGNCAFMDCPSLRVIYAPLDSIIYATDLFMNAYDHDQENEEVKVIILVDNNTIQSYPEYEDEDGNLITIVEDEDVNVPLNGEPTLSLEQIQMCVSVMPDNIRDSDQVGTLQRIFNHRHKRISRRATNYGLNLLHLLVYFPGDIDFVLSPLLQKCPQAATEADNNGNIPFHHAVSLTRQNMNIDCFNLLNRYSPVDLVHQSIKHYKVYGNWYEVKEAAECKVYGLRIRNSVSGLLPFMMLAEANDDNQSIGVNDVYEILQMMPDVLTEFATYNSARKDDLGNKNKKKRKHEVF